jgi:hypothetical protein
MRLFNSDGLLLIGTMGGDDATGKSLDSEIKALR